MRELFSALLLGVLLLGSSPGVLAEEPEQGRDDASEDSEKSEESEDSAEADEEIVIEYAPQTMDEQATQGEPEEETATLEGVTVRGARESRDLSQDRAASGSVLLPEDFDDAGDTLPEVLDQEAGVRVTQMGGPASFSTLSIRGSTSDQVLVVLDAVPLNSAAGGPVDLSRIPLGNVGRIEIYRGVSPLLLGSSAIGGTVSISTRTAHERQLTLSAGGGSFASREARVFYAEPQDTWDVALGLDYSGWDGSFSYENDNGTRFDPSDDRMVTRRNNGFDQVNLLGKARLHLDQSWTLSLMEWFFWRSQGVPGLGQYETKKSHYESLDSLTALSIRGENLADMVDVGIQAGFRASQSQFDDPLDEIGLANDGSEDRSLAPSLSSTVEVRPFSWWDIRGQAGYRYEVLQPSGNSLAASSSSRHSVTAGLESGFHLEPADLLILPSGRMEWADNKMNLSGSTSGETTESESSQTEFSWRAALVNTSIPDTKLSVSGGRAVRLPSLFELFGNSGRVIGNPDLLAEEAINIDGGIIYDSTMLPPEYRLRLEFYGFYSEVKNLIQFVQTAQNVSKAENVDEARMWGLEAGLRSDLFKHLRLYGNYTFLDAVNTGEVAARKDKNLPFRPASKWYVRAEGYVTEIPKMKELALFVDTEWIAGNFLDNANLVSTNDRFYLNTGLSLELQRSIASLSFTANNLTDERTADLAGYPLPGRSFHFLITMRIL